MTRPCNKFDDQCFEEVEAAIPTTPKSEEYAQTCNAFWDENGCNASSRDDYCGGGDAPSGLLTDSFYDLILPCFDEASCDAFEECFGAAYASLQCDEYLP